VLIDCLSDRENEKFISAHHVSGQAQLT